MKHQEINTQNKKCHLGLNLLQNADRILGSHTKTNALLSLCKLALPAEPHKSET